MDWISIIDITIGKMKRKKEVTHRVRDFLVILILFRGRHFATSGELFLFRQDLP